MYSSFKHLGQHAVSGARALHVHAPHGAPPLGRPPGAPHLHNPSQTTGARIFQSARTFLTKVAANLSAPGLTHPAAVQRGAGLSTRVNATVRPPTIESRLSIPAHNVLRGLPRAPFLPKASPASRSVTQVGLGTARNFSTARPIFEHLVQNVPIAARAICEADLDMEKRRMKEKKRVDLKGEAVKAKSPRSLAKPTTATKKTTTTSADEELDRYFTEVSPVAFVPGTTSILLIPLAPTPTTRFPLSLVGTHNEPRFMPRAELREFSSSFHKHSLRVSSLFARLDASRVWDHGATFSAHGDASGICTLLRVEFKGWTENRVCCMLGDAGRGWVEVVEVKDGSDSGLSPSVSSRSISPDYYDPADSVLLPTLDFSASFLASRTSSPDICGGTHSLPPSPPDSLPNSGYSSPIFGLSSISPSEIGDVEMNQDLDGYSFAGSRSPDWTEVGSTLGLSASFLGRSDAELREITF